jgi:hypothetical protein
LPFHFFEGLSGNIRGTVRVPPLIVP